jgi:hypothetical protein
MNATQYALATTEQEIADAYRNLGRMLISGQKENAMKQAIGLIKQDAVRLWNYLREYTSSDVSFLETTPLLVVNALWNNWAQDHKDVFVAHAVLALVQATKGNSAADAMKKHL